MSLVAQVDAFASAPFRGNPAAVCVLTDDRETSWMQQVAAELHVAATAFVRRRDDQGFDLRWFTQTVELDLCGHGTLATAHLLWECGLIPETTPARLHARRGILTAYRQDGWIELDFPALPVQAVSPPDELIRALGVTPVFVGKNHSDYLVEVADESTVRSVRPNLDLLRTIPMRGVMVTAGTNGGADGSPDFVSRFFAPITGIDEDAATGSAHCALTPFWSARLGRSTLVAYQASARGAILKVALKGDRVALRGQAVTVLRGDLLVA